MLFLFSVMNAKEKDPAFLLYSKDFYEGTRMMLPEERACLIDLMIYQQQHGIIPKDIKRVLMYCTGVSQATLKATLEAKFRLTTEGWINDKQAKVIAEREEFTSKQSINGTIGQFWKKAKAILKKAKYTELKDLLYDNTNNEIFELIKGKEISEAMLEAMLIAMPKHLANANEDEIEDKEKEVVSWRNSFDIYRQQAEEAYKSLVADKAFIISKEELNPNVDIALTLKKAFVEYWGKDKAWKHKKKSKTKEIDWVETYTNAININKVYKQRDYQQPSPQEQSPTRKGAMI